MRITLEPTERIEGQVDQQHKVIIETASDGHDIMEMGELLRAALLAWGFHHENVEDLIESR